MEFVENGRLKVLVVEDNNDTANAEIDSLESLGFKLERIAEGTAAKQKVEEFQPDAIILDIDLPGKNGFQIAEELINNPNMRRGKYRVPILIFSVHMENMGDANKDTTGKWQDITKAHNIFIINRNAENSLLKLIKEVSLIMGVNLQQLPLGAKQFLIENSDKNYLSQIGINL